MEHARPESAEARRRGLVPIDRRLFGKVVAAFGFHAAVARAPTPGLSEGLASAAALFALARIEEDRGWFLETGHMEGVKTKAIRALVDRLCAETRRHALPLVEAWGIPGECLAAPIAFGPAAGL